jgi:hypothetical protein
MGRSERPKVFGFAALPPLITAIVAAKQFDRCQPAAAHLLEHTSSKLAHSTTGNPQRAQPILLSQDFDECNSPSASTYLH